MPKIEKNFIQPKMYGDPGIAWIRYDVRTVAGTLIVRLVCILQASDCKARFTLPVHVQFIGRRLRHRLCLKICDLNR
eukprot:scaffold9388_cov54-Attheya_sp.AAC.1